MFSNVKKVARPQSAPKAKGAVNKPTEPVAGWEQFAALDACSKALAALVDTRRDQLKAGPLMAHFVARGLATGTKPDSINPGEGDGKGSSYISKRSTASALAPDEAELIAETVGNAERDEEGAIIKIPGFVEKIDKQPAYLTISPDYMPGGASYDELKLRRIEKLLEKEVPGFFVMVEAESKLVVSEDAVGSMFRLGEAAVAALFPVICLIGTRPVWKGAIERAWGLIKDLLPEGVELAEKAKAEKGTKRWERAGTKKDALAVQLRASLDAAD